MVHNNNKIQLAALALIVNQSDEVAGAWGAWRSGQPGTVCRGVGGESAVLLKMIFFFTRAFPLKKWVKQLQIVAS